MITHLDPASQQSAVAPRPDRASEPLRILMVEDDKDIRQFYARLLVQAGHHVDTAEDGAAGWDALQNNQYDLLITDHSMPKVTGLALVRKLRAAQMTLPVILASGAVPKEELERHPELQLAATLQKPFTCEALLTVISEVSRAPKGPATDEVGVRMRDRRSECDAGNATGIPFPSLATCHGQDQHHSTTTTTPSTA